MYVDTRNYRLSSFHIRSSQVILLSFFYRKYQQTLDISRGKMYVDTRNYRLSSFHIRSSQVILLSFFYRKYQQTLDISRGTWPTIMPFFRIANSKVILNLVNLTLNQLLFSDVWRLYDFVNMVTANYARCCH